MFADYTTAAKEGKLVEVRSTEGYLFGMLRQRMRNAKTREPGRKPNAVRAKRAALWRQEQEKAAAAADEAAAEEGSDSDGVEIDDGSDMPARMKSSKKRKPSNDDDDNAAVHTQQLGVQHTLFVNQLPYGATADDIARFFASSAGVSQAELLPSVRMVRKGERFVGTAFVDMPTVEAQQEGLNLHGGEISCADGSTRKVNVRPALTKQQATELEAARGSGSNADHMRSSNNADHMRPSTASQSQSAGGDASFNQALAAARSQVGDEIGGDAAGGDAADDEVEAARKRRRYEKKLGVPKLGYAAHMTSHSRLSLRYAPPRSQFTPQVPIHSRVGPHPQAR